MIKNSYLSVLLVSGTLLVSGCGGGGSSSGGGNPNTTGDTGNIADDSGDARHAENSGGDTGGGKETPLEPKASYQFQTDTPVEDRDGIGGLAPIISRAPLSCAPREELAQYAVNDRNYKQDIPICSNMHWAGSQEIGEDTWIDASVFVPAHKEGETLPVVLHSHGWGGRKFAELPAGYDMAANLPSQLIVGLYEDGYIVVSFSQRGWGESEGDVMLMNPYFETQDAIAVLDWIAEMGKEKQLPVAVDDNNDFDLALVGSSYGGGFQLPLAMLDQRVDALVPVDAWYSMEQSLMPNGTIKSGAIGSLCMSGVHSGNYHPYLAHACSEASPAAGLLWGVFGPIMPKLSDYFGADLGVLEVPEYVGGDLMKRLANAFSSIPPDVLLKALERMVRIDDLAALANDVIEMVKDQEPILDIVYMIVTKHGLANLEKFGAELLRNALAAAAENPQGTDVDLADLQGLPGQIEVERLLPLLKPLILSSAALDDIQLRIDPEKIKEFLNVERTALFKIDWPWKIPVNAFNSLVNEVVTSQIEKIIAGLNERFAQGLPVRDLVGGLSMLNPPPAKRFADELDPEGEQRHFLAQNGASYLHALEQDRRSFFRNGGTSLSGHPLNVLLIHGMSNTLFPVQEAISNYRYLSAKGGDVRLLTNGGDYRNLLARNPAGPFACGDMDTVSAARQWINAKVRGEGSADMVAIPKVCWSLGDGQSVSLQGIPGTEAAAESFPMETVSASVDGGESAGQCRTVYSAKGAEVLAGVPTISGFSVTGEGRQQAQVGLCLQRDGETIVLGEQLMGFDSRQHDSEVALSGVGVALQAGDQVGLYVTGSSESFNYLTSDFARLKGEEMIAPIKVLLGLLKDIDESATLGRLLADQLYSEGFGVMALEMAEDIVEDLGLPVGPETISVVLAALTSVGLDLEGRLNTLGDEIANYSNEELLGKLVEGAEEYMKAPEATYTVSGTLTLPVLPGPDAADDAEEQEGSDAETKI